MISCRAASAEFMLPLPIVQTDTIFPLTGPSTDTCAFRPWTRLARPGTLFFEVLFLVSIKTTLQSIRMT